MADGAAQTVPGPSSPANPVTSTPVNRGTVTEHSNPQASAATALSQLITEHPELTGLTWTIDTVGVLQGEQHGQDGHGEIVDRCAEILGGTVLRTSYGDGGQHLAQLAAEWRDVLVKIWASYPDTAVVAR